MQRVDAQNNSSLGEGVSYRRLAWVAPIAALVAAAANALVYFAASALGFVTQEVLIPTPGGESPLTVAPVVVSSAAGALGAAAVLAVIGLFSRRPVRLFQITAFMVLMLSFAMPLTIPGAPVAMVLSLELMHVVAWALIVVLLTTLACRK